MLQGFLRNDCGRLESLPTFASELIEFADIGESGLRFFSGEGTNIGVMVFDQLFIVVFEFG